MTKHKAFVLSDDYDMFLRFKKSEKGTLRSILLKLALVFGISLLVTLTIMMYSFFTKGIWIEWLILSVVIFFIAEVSFEKSIQIYNTFLLEEWFSSRKNDCFDESIDEESIKELFPAKLEEIKEMKAEGWKPVTFCNRKILGYERTTSYEEK